MYRIGNDQIDITVNTAAGIPTAGRCSMYDFDCNDILCTAVTGDVITDIKGKRRITVVMFPDLFSVHIDIGIVVNTVKIENE